MSMQGRGVPHHSATCTCSIPRCFFFFFFSLERQWRYRPSSAAAAPCWSDTNSNIYRKKKNHMLIVYHMPHHAVFQLFLLQSPFSALNLSQLSFRVANTMAAISRASVLAVWGSYGTN